MPATAAPAIPAKNVAAGIRSEPDGERSKRRSDVVLAFRAPKPGPVRFVAMELPLRRDGWRAVAHSLKLPAN